MLHDLRVIYSAEESEDSLRNLTGQQRWGRIAYLVVLLGARAFEKVVVGEGLEASRFPDCEAPALGWFVMNEIVAIF